MKKHGYFWKWLGLKFLFTKNEVRIIIRKKYLSFLYFNNSRKLAYFSPCYYGHIVIKCEENKLRSKSLQILYRKLTSMLTGLKVSSFACKYVFYRPQHNAKGDSMELNFGDLEMQKWNIQIHLNIKHQIISKQ